MDANPTPELSRWLNEGQRFFGLCLDALATLERLQSQLRIVEQDNQVLREELVRLRHKTDLLQSERGEMIAAFNDLAGHVTQVVDHILQKSEDGEATR